MRLWAVTASLAAALFIAQGSGAVSTAAPDISGAHTQVMTYEVFAGGFNALSAELIVSEQPEKDSYYLALEAATKGFLGKLVPWSGTFETEGWHTETGRALPKLHRSTAVWRGEKEIKEYRYTRDLTLADYRIIEDGKDKSPESVEEELTEGTIDALTATLAAMKQTVTDNDCTGTSEVFDGKRRFKLVFAKEDEEQFSPTKHNIYEGQAIKCVVEVVPLTGAWHDEPRGWLSIQEQGRDKGALPTVWLAQIDETGPAVPVKIRVKTDYGTLFMHLKNYENGDITLSAAK